MSLPAGDCISWQFHHFWDNSYSDQLLLNNFFDSCTPSMRKVNNGEKTEKRKQKKHNDGNSCHYVVAI